MPTTTRTEPLRPSAAISGRQERSAAPLLAAIRAAASQ
jgi:hypothetical protein